ncbi:malectin domain-containing carbohydrate-binding protein, partial [Falsiroseomonas sp. E2-1-a20]|uniref:malectin domain-containing carbohydrate-binding protein n=1 Tax=Falsiroseomonas sp. E2-1-a20 TaxID=3239300 RepID=UPI003F312B67
MVTNNFAASTLDLNGKVAVNQPTALVWGPDGRLYITEADGDVRVLTVAFGDKNPADSDNTAQFYVTEAITLSLIKAAIQNHNDNGAVNNGQNRQVTGIDVTRQFDADGNPVMINGKPAATIYVTSSDSRIGAGGGGGDVNLDTNSGVITKLVQTGPNTWDAIDIVRGLPRSEENHASNGLEVIQTIDPVTGNLVSERMILASGGNANSGAPSNNFAGQQEQPLSGALLEIDLTMLSGMPVQTTASGRKYVYDIPTLDDPTRTGNPDNNDPFGGNDGFNSAKLVAGGPVSIYSPGYRNAYDVEVSDDGRVWTYDNGANNSWGGRPIGEAGDNGSATDLIQALGYIATNLNNGEGNTSDPINLINWNPSNKDNFHEATRSDDLAGRAISAGQGGAQTFEHEGLTYVYGGHPNPTRAEGSRAGLLFSPGTGANDAYLLVSNTDSYGNGGGSDYAEVIAWLTNVEAANPKNGIYGVNAGDLTKKVLAVTPGQLYEIYKFADGSGAAVVAGGSPPANGTLIGQSGLPSDIAEIVAYHNPIEGDYKEAGKTDGALDSGNGSINGLTEYTSTILDQGGVKMSGAIIAAQLNGGNLIIMGRNADGTMSSGVSGGFAVAADRTTFQTGAAPLGLAAIGDDFIEMGLSQPFQGSVWVASYSTSQPFIQILQPNNGAVPLAGSEIVNPTDRDLDGVTNLVDPFELSATNGFALAPGEQLLIDFNPQNTNFPNTISATGLLGAALDGVTPNRDAQTAAENFAPDQQFPGLYDIGGNILPGGNAPILQIKKVIAGTVVGAANTARDALHTGIRPSDDVDRIVATIEAKNWILEKSGVAVEGQLTGMMFGDGTQSNFVRFVFGAVPDGAGVTPGFEVGFEIGDVYTVLSQTAVAGLTNAAANSVELRLTIDKQAGFTVTAEYRLEGQADFTSIPLGGFALPEGVLRNVLTGDHTIGSGAATQPSGAAIGFLAENAAGEELDAVDFYSLRIEAFGNEIVATDAGAVGAPGSPNVDTVIYTGTDTALSALAPDVENFDGTGSTANYAVTANALDNVIRPGTGVNVITTGAGDDVVRGTLAQLAGDEITDFSNDDRLVVEGALINDFNVVYGTGSATLTINGAAPIIFSGPDFADFTAADGLSVFRFIQSQDGVEITTAPALTPFIAISSGSADLPGATLREQTVNFVSDVGTGAAAAFVTGVTSKTYTNATIGATNIPGTELDLLHQTERSAVDAGKWGYSIPVPNGEYLIDLIFAEIFHGVANAASNAVPGKRVFDIFVENGLVEPNFDIIAAAGGTATEVIKTYQATVADGVLNIEFDATVDQAKISGLVVWELGGTFVPPADTAAPVIDSIFVENPQLVQDGPRFATVVLKDETGFDQDDFGGLTGAELSFTGIVPASVSAPVVVLSGDGKTATLTYTLEASGGAWPAGVGQVSVAAGAYGDAAGNVTAAANTAFVLQPNLGSLARGDVVRAINLGTTDTAPGTLGVDPFGQVTDNNRYGGAIAADSLILDAFGNPVAFQADNPLWYTSPKTNAQLNANVDGQSGTTGSNSGGEDLDGSAYHTYRDSAAGAWTATYGGFAPGTYVVEVHFAELFHATGGLRQGDFTINGQVLALNFDPFTAAGGADKRTTLTKAVTVTDGNVVIGVSADTGQPGINAVVIYQAVDPNLPPTISVADAQAVEGGDAVVTFTRTGDLSEAVTVTFVLTPGTASEDDYTSPASTTVVIPANQGSASITIPIVDDTREEPAQSFTVSLLSVSNASNTAVIGDNTATITIAANDFSLQIPPGGALLNLDFETPGTPLAQGGFDGVLGGPGALDPAAEVVVEGGKLKVVTSDGDLSQGGQVDSKNDFIKQVDVSDPALTQLYLTAQFDNPFTQNFMTSRGVTNGIIQNYAQQGILFAVPDDAVAQNSSQFVKLVFGGNAGNAVQLWTQGNAVNQTTQVTAMSSAAVAAGGDAFGLFDIARVELSIAVDRGPGTIGQFVTFFDAEGEILGGVRPTATAGFVTAAPVAIPPPLAAAFAAGAVDVGITSTDYTTTALDAFTATWDFLRLSSPQYTPPVVEPTGPDSVRGTVIGDFSDDGAEPTAIGVLQLGDNVIVAAQQGDSEPGGRDRDYFTFTVAEGQVLSQLVLQGFATDEVGLPQGFIGIQEGPVVTTDPTTYANSDALLGGLVYNGGLVSNDILDDLAEGATQGFSFIGFDTPLGAGTYTIWLNQGGAASTATLNFMIAEAPVAEPISLTIGNAPTVLEEGDAGFTTLLFPITASENFSGDVTVSYDTAGASGLTALVSFVDGAGVLSLPVANDDLANGDDLVSVTLTGGTGGANTFEIATATATGLVTEDDTAPVLVRGGVVAAYNAGGPAMTFDGIAFAAAASGTTGVFAGGEAFTDSTGGNGLQPVFNGTVYQTEVNSGPTTDATPGTFSFSAPVAPDKLYFVDLYMAEIYTDVVGGRVFDVFVEGSATPALNDFDIVAATGSSNSAIVVRLAEPIAPGANGAIDLSFVTVTDRAKVSAIVIREAVAPVPPGTIAIADAPTMVEGGDAGQTMLVFPLTLAGTDATVLIGYSVGGVAQAPVEVSFTGGVGSLSVPVANDNVDTGTRTVEVAITSLPSGFTIAGGGTASGDVTDDDVVIVNPDDLDGDGIPNIDDPFAYDGSNGLGRALTPGTEFRQDFDTSTNDPFSAGGGFTGILVNPLFSPPGASGADPYGDRTVEAKVTIAAGALSITSSPEDTNVIGGTTTSNLIRDNYQSGVDVSRTQVFEVSTRVTSADFVSALAPSGFAQFGVQVGAGGVDDFVKLVFSDNQNNPPRLQIGHNQSLLGTSSEANVPMQGTAPNAISFLGTVAAYEVRLTVDRSVTAVPAGAAGVVEGVPTAGSVLGVVEFFDALGVSLGTLTAGPRYIVPTSALAQAMANENPLTGGTGGLAYGVAITDGTSATNQFTANFDYLVIRSLDEAPNQAPTAVVLSNLVTTLAEGTQAAAVKVADIAVSDDGLGTNVLSLQGDDAALFEIVGQELFLKAGAVLDFEVNPQLDVTVQVDDAAVGGSPDATAAFTLAVTDVDENQAPTAVVLTPVLTSVAENVDTSVRTKVADIAVSDDGLGTNVLSLQG